jgi:hypothetical protein
MNCDRCGGPNPTRVKELEEEGRMVSFRTSAPFPKESHFPEFPYWPKDTGYSWALCEDCYQEMVSVAKRQTFEFLVILTHPRKSVKVD